MALKNCKECGKPVSTEAKSCPNCGAKAPKRTSAFTWIVGIFLIFSVAAVLTNTDGNTTAPASSKAAQNLVPPPSAPTEITRTSATGGCMLAIKKSLHDPDSASFSHSDEATVKIKGDRAMVIRQVQAVNGFGAKRKSDFICFLEKRGDNIHIALVAEAGRNTSDVKAIAKKWGM